MDEIDHGHHQLNQPVAQRGAAAGDDVAGTHICHDTRKHLRPLVLQAKYNTMHKSIDVQVHLKNALQFYICS